MKFYRNISVALAAGIMGLCLLSNAATAQQQTPVPDQAQQSAQKQAQKAVPKGADIDAQAKQKAQIEAQSDPQAGTNAKAGAKTKAGSNAKSDASSQTTKSSSGTQAGADTKANAASSLSFDPNQTDSLTLAAPPANSLAAKAGLQQGDQIVSVNGQRFSSQAAVNNYLMSHQGQQFPVTFIRNGQRHSVMLSPRRTAAYRGDPAWNGQQPIPLGTTFAGNSRGLVINDVNDGSPAHRAGLRNGDRITCFNGWSFQSPAQFASWLNRFPRGQALPVTYARNGRLYSTRVTLRGPNGKSAGRRQPGYDDNSGRPVPPPSPGAETAQSTNEGRRRTALRPNFDAMTRSQLEQEIQQLRRENSNLRQQIDAQQQERGTNRPQSQNNNNETDQNSPSAQPSSPPERTETPLN